MTTNEIDRAGRLAGKVCLVTGSTTGIGSGIAERLAAEGATVLVTGRRAEAGEAVAARLTAAGAVASSVAGDLTHPADCARVVDTCFARYGRLDGLVHNAGLSRRGTVVDTPLADWQEVFALNVQAAYLLAQHAIPRMAEQGGGSIVHIGSVHTTVPKRNMAAYCASRGALLMLSRQMAVEYLGQRIRVNVVNPGWVDTPGERDLLVNLGQAPDVMDRAAQNNPLGRLLAPRDIAVVVAYLVSDESELVTGSAFDIHHEHPLAI